MHVLDVGRPLDARRDQRGVHAGFGILACAIDTSQDDVVRARQGLRKALGEDTGPRVQVRLEDDGDLTLAGDDLRLADRSLG